MAFPGVYFVGAGPGDPDLLTVKAARLLAIADMVFYTDSLIPPQILAGVRPEASCIPTADKTLESLLPLMVEAVQQGQMVVRLHDGDPSLYSAIYEQIQGLLAAGISVEVVPGVSAFQLAAARLKTELTVPGLVQTIILTRMSGRTQVPETEELSALAAHQASLCLYLSAKHVAEAQAALLLHYPATTPVAIGWRLGWPEEQIWRSTLAEMAAVSQREQLVRSTLYLISPALGLDPSFEQRSQLYHPQHDRLFRNPD